MREQRAKILAAAQLPNVWLGVLPGDRPAVTLESSGFVLYDLPDGPLLLIELLSRELQVRAEWDVRIYRDAFARLEAAAVTGEDAAALIRGLLPEAGPARSEAGPGPCRTR